MILTDGDLFPPGTIQLNGVKVFGEDAVPGFLLCRLYGPGGGLRPSAVV